MIEYKTNNVCSSKILFDIKDNCVCSVSFKDGCEGNLEAISRLVEGMNAQDLIEKLKGIKCESRSTSCADQLARAVESAIYQATRTWNSSFMMK